MDELRTPASPTPQAIRDLPGHARPGWRDAAALRGARRRRGRSTTATSSATATTCCRRSWCRAPAASSRRTTGCRRGRRRPARDGHRPHPGAHGGGARRLRRQDRRLRSGRRADWAGNVAAPGRRPGPGDGLRRGQRAASPRSSRPVTRRRQDRPRDRRRSTDARTRSSPALGSGASLVNYLGHGGLDRLSGRRPARPAPTSPALTNGDRLPVLTAMTCTVNRFAVPGVPSLGELLVEQPDGGAAAVLGPSGLALHAESRRLAGDLLPADRRSRGALRLGDLVLRSHAGACAARAAIRRCWTSTICSAIRRCASALRPVPPGREESERRVGRGAPMSDRLDARPEPPPARAAPTSRRASSIGSRWRPWPRSARRRRPPRAIPAFCPQGPISS